LNISASVLAALDFDPNGDTLTVTAVNGATTSGSVKLSGGTITYTPPNNFVGSDQFTYTISEVHLGGTATSTAKVTVVLGTVTSLFSYISPPDSNGYVYLRGFGVPGRAYNVEYSSDPSFPAFTILATVTAAPGNGVILCTDTSPTSPRYYRFAAVNP
jgi:hypothetical protein